jgi:two-component system response regulator
VNKLKTILYADDDLDDKAWVSEACKALNSSLDVQFLGNGKDVFRYLERLDPQSLPTLIVLDLNMPEMDGRQTLKALKENPHYKEIPVVIVTTSSNKLDRDICNRLGATKFLTKPDSHREWQNVVRELEPLSVGE